MSEGLSEIITHRRTAGEKEYRQSERDRRNGIARRKAEALREQLEIERQFKNVWED